MDVRQLRYFSEIVKQRSFGKASQLLHIAQPALSLQIKNLETELGIQLLKRHARGVEPTAEGTILFDRASHILAGMDSIKADMMSSVLLEQPATIRLGINPSSEISLISRFVKVAGERLPHVRLSFVEGPGPLIVELVRKGDLDFGLAYDVPAHPDLQSEVFSLQHAVFVQSAINSKPADGNEISLEEVIRHPLTLPREPHACRVVLDLAAKARGLTMLVPLELVVGKAMMVDFISRNLIHTILPRSAAEAIAAATPSSVRRITDPDIHFAEHLVYSNARPLSAHSKAVRELMQEISQGATSIAEVA